MLRNKRQRSEAFDMSMRRHIQPGQQAKETGFSTAIAAHEPAQSRFKRER